MAKRIVPIFVSLSGLVLFLSSESIRLNVIQALVGEGDSVLYANGVTALALVLMFGGFMRFLSKREE